MDIRDGDCDIIMQETPELESYSGMACGKTPALLWTPTGGRCYCAGSARRPSPHS
jgi:hypothetical protein